jgi:hypothetical protein
MESGPLISRSNSWPIVRSRWISLRSVKSLMVRSVERQHALRTALDMWLSYRL